MANLPCCNPCITCAPTASRDGRNIIDPDPLDPNNPFLNLSSELPDVNYFIGTNYTPPGQPPLNSLWYQSSCVGVCTSSISQADADACAQRANLQCISNNWPIVEPNPDSGNPVPPGFPPQPPLIPNNRPLFGNTPQSCEFVCPDGAPFIYTVPAGTYFGLSQAAANAIASNVACQRAITLRLCIGSLDIETSCEGLPYTGNVSVSNQASITSIETIGSFPPGLFISQSMSGVVFEGSPTTAGTYTFTLVVTDSLGTVSQRQFTIVVEGFATASALPNGVEGSAYSKAILTNNTVTPMVWAIASGSLPPGLSLNSATGVISGIPTLAGNYTFTLTYNDQR